MATVQELKNKKSELLSYLDSVVKSAERIDTNCKDIRSRIDGEMDSIYKGTTADSTKVSINETIEGLMAVYPAMTKLKEVMAKTIDQYYENAINYAKQHEGNK